MATGRKQTPKQGKILKGTFRKDRDNPNAPVQAPDSMRAPSWLTKKASEHFGALRVRIEALGLDSSSYTEALGLAAMTLEEIEKHTATIEEFGAYSYETMSAQGGRMIRPHPAVAQRSDAIRRLQSLLAEFGLTPAAIGKVSAKNGKGDAGQNPWSGFGG